MTDKQRCWGIADNAKLRTLWQTPHNGVDPSRLDIDSVKAVWDKYFKSDGLKYANFAPLYRGKARNYNVGGSLDGHRKSTCEFFFSCCYCCLAVSNALLFPGSKAAKQAAAGRTNLEDISDDEDDPFEDNDEEDEDLEADEDIDADETEEQEPAMSARKTKKKAGAATPSPAPAAKKAAASVASGRPIMGNGNRHDHEVIIMTCPGTLTSS
jgi:hypothetical protein